MIVGQEDKPPLDELAHYGVKGMKWGVTHDTPGGGGSSSPTKQDIYAARAKVYAHRQKYGRSYDAYKAALKRGDQKTADYHDKRMLELDRQAATSDYEATAMRMTRGEKVAAYLLAGPLGLAYVGLRSAQRKSAERGIARAKKEHGVN